jgi:hypothetical protein
MQGKCRREGCSPRGSRRRERRGRGAAGVGEEEVAGVDVDVQMEILASWPWCSLLREMAQDEDGVKVIRFPGSGELEAGHGDGGGGRQWRWCSLTLAHKEVEKVEKEMVRRGAARPREERARVLWSTPGVLRGRRQVASIHEMERIMWWMLGSYTETTNRAASPDVLFGLGWKN